MEKMVQHLIDNGIASADEIQGCSDEEVAHIEQHFSIRLPKAYRDFLLTAGRAAGTLFRGSDVLYPKPLVLSEWANQLLQETAVDFEMPDDTFVFLMHQGYILQFFKLSEGDDPPVYEYAENQPAATQIAGSFSDFLRGAIDMHLRIAKRLSSQESGDSGPRRDA